VRLRTAIACALLTLTSVGAGVASARRMPPPREPRDDPDRGDFWRDVIEPHSAEIAQLLRRAHDDFQNAAQAATQDYDPLGTRRAISIHDAYSVMHYARTLSPHNPEVLQLFGQAADELGKTREALDAFHAYLQLVDPAKSDGDVAGRLGIIYLRLGELDDAIRYLRLAVRPLGSNGGGAAFITVGLATALAQRGDMIGAIETLVDALPPTTGYYSNEQPFIAFTLAVMYDRDDQRSAAFETLDKMQTAMQTGYAAQLQQVLSGAPLANDDDAAYYLGLFYESVGLYTEARTEWMTYAAIADAPWRGRALEHVAALDEERRTAKPPARTPLEFGAHPIIAPPAVRHHVTPRPRRP
jgi:tetratricopeptide (TPR) repeat protein